LRVRVCNVWQVAPFPARKGSGKAVHCHKTRSLDVPDFEKEIPVSDSRQK
jgi:hypothetical protein